MQNLGPALLFCPGDRPDRFDKALDRADTVIFDLEDAVPSANKADARRLAAQTAAEANGRALVRINGADSEWFADDVAAMRAAGVATLVLPKASSVEELQQLAGFDVIGLCETAAGALNAVELAREPNCVGLMWGGEDLVADLGGRSSRDANGRYYPLIEQLRATILFATAAVGKIAIDAVHVDIGDLEGLARETGEAVALGYDAKACIHPDHVEVIRRAFVPSAEQIAWAAAVLSHPLASSGGVFRVGTEMIDGPLLLHAENIVNRVLT